MSLLPTIKTKPKYELDQQIILVYGPPKSGKTTWIANFPSVLLLATEPGHNSHEIYAITIDSWEKFLGVLAELSKVATEGKQTFKNIAIDTIDNLLDFCSEYVLKKNGMLHGSDDNNKGYTLISAEFGRVMKKISLLPYGLVMTSHIKETKVKTRTGDYPKQGPNVSGKNAKIILGLSDLILYFEIVSKTNKETGEILDERIIRTIANQYYEAGARIKGLEDKIPLDFQTFKKSYENTVKQQGKK